MSSDLDASVRAIFHRVFELSPDVRLDDGARRGHLERWDSLGHLELLEALRSEFKIDIPPDQALEMETYADVKRVVGTLRG